MVHPWDFGKESPSLILTIHLANGSKCTKYKGLDHVLRWKSWILCGLARTHNCQPNIWLKYKMHQTDFTKIFPTKKEAIIYDAAHIKEIHLK